MSSPPPGGRSSRTLDLASGGWVLLLAGVLMLGVFAWRLAAIWPTLSRPAIGDGEHVDSYGFDLSNLRVSRDELVAAGLPRDGLPALVCPPAITAAQAAHGPRLAGVRVLHASDPVVGVVVGGEARAYPLWILVWHEVVNDTLGGEPILVTYSGPSDACAVFERRVGGREREFGVSGLLYNSNLLMYDRCKADETPSLWSQLLFAAISGPAAERGETLKLLPAMVVSWGEWSARHPETTVILPDPARKRLYRRDAYLAYQGSPKLHFPTSPLPEGGALPLKMPVVAVRQDGAWRVYRADEFVYPSRGELPVSVRALWFAWYAMHPDSVVAVGGL